MLDSIGVVVLAIGAGILIIGTTAVGARYLGHALIEFIKLLAMAAVLTTIIVGVTLSVMWGINLASESIPPPLEMVNR